VRAVWSWWSKPYDAGRGFCWRKPIHHLLAWGQSFRLVQAHYPETVLVTDGPGRALLVDKLGLPFTHVSTELDRLRDADPRLWALSKLVAYSLQDKPFVHLDSDVFLWRPLPARVTSAPVLAQHPETGDPDGPRVIEDAFARAGLSLPAEWRWSRSHSARTSREANCGILGGTNVGFIRHYAQLALDIVSWNRDRRRGQPAIRRLSRRQRRLMLPGLVCHHLSLIVTSAGIARRVCVCAIQCNPFSFT